LAIKNNFVVLETHWPKYSAESSVAGLLSLPQFFGEGGHDFEDVADDAVVRDLEDRGVLVFIDGDDGARALHADNVLNCAADAERKIEFWRDGLAGAADLALHRKPAFVANWTRRGDFSAHRFCHRFGLRNIFGR